MAKTLYVFKAYISLDEEQDAQDFHDLLLREVEEVCVHEVGVLEATIWEPFDEEEAVERTKNLS